MDAAALLRQGLRRSAGSARADEALRGDRRVRPGDSLARAHEDVRDRRRRQRGRQEAVESDGVPVGVQLPVQPPVPPIVCA